MRVLADVLESRDACAPGTWPPLEPVSLILCGIGFNLVTSNITYIDSAILDPTPFDPIPHHSDIACSSDLRFTGVEQRR